MLIDTIGWVGSFLFSICAIPQAIDCYKKKNSDGLDSLFLLTWLLGEVLCLIYGYFVDLPLPVIVNYVVNLSCLLVICYYKVRSKWEK